MNPSRPLHSASHPSRSPGRSAADYDDDGLGLIIPADDRFVRPDNLEDRVQSTQQRLAQLRMEAEALEREKREFEELSRKQREFIQGRSEMVEKFTRALAHLEREEHEAYQRIEQLRQIRESFARRLEVVESLNPEHWNSQNLQHDLNHALGVIEDAREEFALGMHHAQALTSAPVPVAAASPVLRPANEGAAPAAFSSLDGMPRAFNLETLRVWAFCGLGFTLPLLALGLLFFVAWLVAR